MLKWIVLYYISYYILECEYQNEMQWKGEAFSLVP